MSEQYNNLASSTVATGGGINNSSNPVTFSVQAGDGALFPATTNGSFRVTVSNPDGTNAEVMLCTSISTDALTCARGSSATKETPTPSLLSHSQNSIVSHNITTGAMNQIRNDLSGIGTFSGLPASGGARIGDQYIATDSVYDRFVFDGSVWQPLLGSKKCITVTSATFATSITGAGASVDTFANNSDGSLTFIAHKASGTDNVAAKLFAYPSAPFTKRMRVYMAATWGNFDNIGFCLSDGTKLITWGPAVDTSDSPSVIWRGINWTNSTTASAEAFFSGYAYPCRGGYFDMEFIDDGTNRNLNIYIDGITKIPIYTEGNTAFLTPTKFGIAIVPYGTTTGSHAMTIASWGAT